MVDQSDTIILPDIKEAVSRQKERFSFVIPQFHVVLLDDDDHSYDYVVEMLHELFGYAHDQAFRMACLVDSVGRVIVDTATKERAELRRDQILSYGPDWRLPGSQKSMTAVIEPVD